MSSEPERRRIEIVHESLLTKWPRLVHWQTQDAEGAQLRDELRHAAHLWQQHDRSRDFLWTGTAYREFQLWRERYPGNLTETEEEFAEAMTAHAQRRRRRRTAGLFAAFGMLFLVIGVITLSWRRTDVARQRAENEARRAKAAKLLALGQVELDSYPTAALAYATKSLEVADSEEARRFAVRALWRGPTAFILPLRQGDFYQIKFSPSGKWLAASSIADNVIVFPSSGGQPIVLGGHEATGNNRHSEFGPGSDLLVTRAWKDPLRIWSIPEGKLVRRIEVEGWGSFVQRAGELWMLSRAANTDSYTLRRWVLPDGRDVDLGNVEIPNITRSSVANWDVDPTGTWLALPRERQVLLRSLRTSQRAEEQLVGTHPENLNWIAFGANRRLLSRDAGGEIRVWSLEGEKPRLLRAIRGSASERSPRFDPTASRVAAADPTERVIRIWDVAGAPELEPLQLRRGDADRIEQLDFAPSHGPWLAAISLTSASLWPMTRDYSRVFRGHTNPITRVRFGPNGSWVVSGSLDDTVRIWPLDNRAGTGTRVILNATKWIYGLAVDPSGKRILISDVDNHVFLVKPDAQQSPFLLKPGLPFAPEAAAFDRDGRRAAVGTAFSERPEDRVIRIWDVETGEVVRVLNLVQGHRVSPDASRSRSQYDGGVTDVEFAPDGSLYSAGSGGVRKWDVARGTSQNIVEGKKMIMDLSDDGRYLLTADKNGSVRYHDLVTRTSRTLASHGSEVVTVALDPTGTIAVTGSSDGTIRVGRVTGQEPHLLFGHGGLVKSVAVSPDGRWIASGGQDGTVRVWPMPDLSKPPLHTLPHDKLLAKLKSLTNLRVIEDANSANGYKLDVGPFPGWENVPVW